MHTLDPYAIHLTSKQSIALSLVDQGRLSGARLLHVSLSGVTDLDSLERLLLAAVKPPSRTIGFDAIVDLFSDLSWLPSSSGYLLLADGLDEGGEAARSMFLGLWPDIVDRWRSQGVPFSVVLEADMTKMAALELLRTTNRSLADFGLLRGVAPGTGAVPIYVDGALDGDPAR